MHVSPAKECASVTSEDGSLFPIPNVKIRPPSAFPVLAFEGQALPSLDLFLSHYYNVFGLRTDKAARFLSAKQDLPKIDINLFS